jgi:ribonuclease T1
MRSLLVASWLVAVAVLAGCGMGGPPGPSGDRGPLGDPTIGPGQAIDPVSGLSMVELADLPPEATETLALIDREGPFPYDQDGAVFQNREGILPDRPSGYYREYTVETPGSPDRGARRIVSGADGELYWTADHYDSFERIRR